MSLVARFAALSMGLVLLTTPVMVLAQAADEPSAVVGPEATTMQTQTTESKSTKEARDARAAERKAKLKTVLDTTQKRRIEDRCVASQGKITTLKSKVQGYDKGYVVRYDTLLGKLSDISVKLKAKNLDTAKLDTATADLTTQVATFKSGVATYRQTIDDLTTMDCKADPAGFKAAVEASRSQLAALRSQVSVIRATLKDSVRPELQALRTQLKTTETNDATQ